jgi:hypothetical protein
MRTIRIAGGAVAEPREPRLSIWQRIEREWQARLHRATAQQPLVQPTAEEARNGWTAENLTAYLAERAASQAMTLDVASLLRRLQDRPREANHRYDPHRIWRNR